MVMSRIKTQGPVQITCEKFCVLSIENKQQRTTSDHDNGHLSCNLCGQVAPIQNKNDGGKIKKPRMSCGRVWQDRCLKHGGTISLSLKIV